MLVVNLHPAATAPTALLVPFARLALGHVQFFATLAVTVATIAATRGGRTGRGGGRCRCGGTCGGPGRRRRHRRGGGGTHLGRSAQVFLGTTTRLGGFPALAIQQIFFQQTLVLGLILLGLFISVTHGLLFGLSREALGFVLSAFSLGLGRLARRDLLGFQRPPGRFGLTRCPLFSGGLGRCNRLWQLGRHEGAALADFNADRLGRRATGARNPDFAGFLALQRYTPHAQIRLGRGGLRRLTRLPGGARGFLSQVAQQRDLVLRADRRRRFLHGHARLPKLRKQFGDGAIQLIGKFKNGNCRHANPVVSGRSSAQA